MSAGQITQGRRISDADSGAGMRFLPGDYNRVRGTWHACTPSGALGNLANHDVTENEDGTITVFPSILVISDHDGKTWHGYLERGVWREV